MSYLLKTIREINPKTTILNWRLSAMREISPNIMTYKIYYWKNSAALKTVLACLESKTFFYILWLPSRVYLNTMIENFFNSMTVSTLN